MQSSSFPLTLTAPVNAGDRLFLVSSSGKGMLGCATTAAVPSVRVGTELSGEGVSFRVLAAGWLPGKADDASGRMLQLEAVQDTSAGEYECAPKRCGYSLAWITLSDKGAAGKRVDESGPLIGEQVGQKLDLTCVQGFIIPDETEQLKGLLVDLALNQGFDIIMTTGGTGVGPRDVTPEATLAVIEKRLPGYERAMTAASLQKTPHGAISRAVAGTLAQTLVVNMPGSPKAVAECLEPLLPTLKHTLEKLQGDPSDCAALRK